MLSGLWHWAICSGYNQDGTVHLGCTSNHVLYIVSVSRAVYVSIVSVLCFILNMRSSNGNSSFSFFRDFVDGIESPGFCCTLLGQHSCNSCCQGSLAVVNVTNCTNIDVRLSPFKLLFCHIPTLLIITFIYSKYI